MQSMVTTAAPMTERRRRDVSLTFHHSFGPLKKHGAKMLAGGSGRVSKLSQALSKMSQWQAFHSQGITKSMK